MQRDVEKKEEAEQKTKKKTEEVSGQREAEIKERKGDEEKRKNNDAIKKKVTLHSGRNSVISLIAARTRTLLPQKAVSCCNGHTLVVAFPGT